MNPSQVKRVLQEAAKLPPAKARRVLAALQAKDEPEDDEPERGEAFRLMETAMLEAVLKTLEEDSRLQDARS
jgi:hypothetical protein